MTCPAAGPRGRVRRPLLAALAALALLALPLIAAPSHAQEGQAGDLLLLLAGSDTVAVERFTRTGTRLQSELLIRAAGARISFDVTLDARGSASRFQMAMRQAASAPDSPPMQQADARFTADSVIVELTGGGRNATQRFATTSGALPFVNPSMALMELVVRRARAMGGDSVQVPVWLAQGGTTTSAAVVRVGADSVVAHLGAPLHFAVDRDGEILGGAIPSQNLRIVRVRGGTAGARDALAVEKPDYSAPAGAPYTAEDVTIPTSMGHTLAGTLTMPRGAQSKVPAVVTITGSGAQDRDESLAMVKGFRPFRQVADTLGRHGIAVLRMDDRGWGASTGDHGAATSADFAEDIRAGLAYLRTRPEIDGARLALLGHSEGGLIAPLVAVREPALRALVLMAGPAQGGRQILQFQIGNGIAARTDFTAAQRDSALGTVDALIDSLGSAQPWMKFFIEHDPLSVARQVRIPTLILQGETDRQVTAEQAEALGAAMRTGGNRAVTVRVFPRANHLFIEDADGRPQGYSALSPGVVRSDVLAAIVGWLQATLR